MIPVRELTAYLLTRPRFNKDEHKVILVCELDENTSSSTFEKAGMDAFESPDTPCPQLEGIVKPRLEKLARSMVDGWTPNMVRVFYLHTGQGMDLGEAARSMGYKGASGAKYQLGLVFQDVRRHTAAWPLLSPPDLDENIFNEFLEQVLFFCKQRINCRNQDQQRTQGQA